MSTKSELIYKSLDLSKKLLVIFSKLGTDYKKNISQLVYGCGKILKADACMYNRLEGEMLSTISGWQLPHPYKNIDKAKGHICYDVIKEVSPGKVLVVKDLPHTSYSSDPNIRKFKLKTYMGTPVMCAGEKVGALCVVYKTNLRPSNTEIQIIKLFAAFIGIEESRQYLDKQLYKRLQFEGLIGKLARQFISVSYDNIDEVINKALEEIGEFCEVDRSYIFLGYDRGRKVKNTHEWCAEGIKPLINELKELKAEDFKWFAQKIRNKEVVYVPFREQLPKEAECLKRLLSSQGVVSLLCVPMVYENEVIGFLGFDAVRKPKEWSATDITILQIAGEIFASLITHKKMTQKIMYANTRLKSFSFKDPLTGLYNQRYYEEVIEREFQRAKRQVLPLSVLIVDLDYFKSINEIYGFRFGDLVLIQLAKKIRKLVRRYDIVIRYSGEEFIIITPGIDRIQAVNLAQRILDSIRITNFGNHREKIKLKVSIAVVSYPEDKLVKSKDIAEFAEKLLMKAKEKGGDRVVSALDIQREVETKDLRKSSLKQINGIKNKIQRLTQKANQSLMESIYAFAKTIEAKDQYTGEHVEKTVYYAVEIAKKLSLSAQEIEFIRQAAILHDLGKVGISERILTKRDRLNSIELKQIKHHPQIAVEILRPVHFFQPVIPIILSHHERWDGKGYPNGLKKEEIPLGARILAVADVFQALISDRPYRKAYSFNDAIEIIKKGRGTHFDPLIVDTFLEILKEKKD